MTNNSYQSISHTILKCQEIKEGMKHRNYHSYHQEIRISLQKNPLHLKCSVRLNNMEMKSTNQLIEKVNDKKSVSAFRHASWNFKIALRYKVNA